MTGVKNPIRDPHLREDGLGGEAGGGGAPNYSDQGYVRLDGVTFSRLG